ncbi:MAG: response regulator [Thermodesulfobacteriota bacterium]|nr:response regulator [Thermodesulfobacteriota bacterium]
MKILIVDDKTSIRKEIKKILTQLEFDDVTEAVDGNDAWFKLKAEFEGRPAEKFDLIISDMEMPKMSGLELLEAVRKDKILKDMPFIMVTTVNTKDVILKTMKLGIQAYIIKPFNLKSVAAKLVQTGILK